jgi:hypothetical protein
LLSFEELSSANSSSELAFPDFESDESSGDFAVGVHEPGFFLISAVPSCANPKVKATAVSPPNHHFFKIGETIPVLQKGDFFPAHALPDHVKDRLSLIIVHPILAKFKLQHFFQKRRFR